MNRERRHAVRRVMRACASLVLSGVAGIAGAAQFSINPTRVHLHGDHPVETLMLRNEESRPVSFEVEVKRWRQDAEGRWELTPSDGLVVHPLILTLPAGEQARLRIGTLTPAVDSEQDYRVELQELADPTPTDSVQIKMLTRLSLPVFVQPPKAQPAAAVAVTELQSAATQLTVSNHGTAYLPPHDARLRVLDAQGRAVHEDTLAVGYVLPGAQLRVPVKLPAGICARAERVELTLDSSLPPLDASIAPSVRRCGR